MTIPFVEILTESREISADQESTSQSFVIEFQLPTKELEPDELEDPDFSSGLATFLGATDDVLALETAYSIIPMYRFLPDSNGNGLFMVLENVKVSQKTNVGDWWRAEFNYKFSYNEGQGAQSETPPDTDDMTLPFIRIGFQVGNSSRHITESKEFIGADTANGIFRGVPDTKTAIGVSKDNVEGADVDSGGLQLQITAYYYPAKVTLSWINSVAAMFTPDCPVNSNKILTQFLPGEAKLLGMSGQAIVGEVIPITFDLSIIKNRTLSDENFSDTEDPDVEGHWLIDYRYIEELDETAATMLQKPSFRFLHRVYDEKDFSILGFPGSNTP